MQILRQTILDWHTAERELERRRTGKTKPRQRRSSNLMDIPYYRPEVVQTEIKGFFLSGWFGILFYDFEMDGKTMYQAMQDKSVAAQIREMEKGRS